MAQHTTLQPTAVGSADWFNYLPDSNHSRFFTRTKWEETAMGALTIWSPELRLYTFQAFADGRPVCLFWGPTRIAIYNEAYSEILGGKHPVSMGLPFSSIFPEVEHIIFPMMTHSVATRSTSFLEEVTLTILRNNFVEETFFKGAFVPLMMFDGSIGGLHNSPTEVTRERLNDRRARMLNRISAFSEDLTSRTVYRHIAECFAENSLDVPFAMLFKVEVEVEDGNHQLALVENIGLPPARAEKQLTHLHDEQGFMPYLRAAQTRISITWIDDNFAVFLLR